MFAQRGIVPEGDPGLRFVAIDTLVSAMGSE